MGVGVFSRFAEGFPMIFPHTLFRQAGLNTTDIAAIFGVSRVTAARWLSGVNRSGAPGAGVNVLLEDRVTRGVQLVQAAVNSGALPDSAISALPPAKRRPRIRSILHQHRAK